MFLTYKEPSSTTYTYSKERDDCYRVYSEVRRDFVEKTGYRLFKNFVADCETEKEAQALIKRLQNI